MNLGERAARLAKGVRCRALPEPSRVCSKGAIPIPYQYGIITRIDLLEQCAMLND